MTIPVPKPPSKIKKLPIISLIVVFASVFGLILLVMNLPAIINSVDYSFTHSTDSDNQKLTEQYRALYGFANHPELNPFHILPLSAASQFPPQYQISQATQSFDLSIPKLNLSAPVIQVPVADDKTILAALKNGVVQFPGSVSPGQSGETVIIGHSSSNLPWTKYSAIFSELGKLQPEDLIYLKSPGSEYVYRVTVIKKGSAKSILDSGISGDLLLSTCWPVGTDTNRIAVAAVLVK